MFFSSQYRLPHRSKLAMESKRRHFPSPKLYPFRYLWPSSWSRLRIARRSPASRAARPSPSPKNTRRPRRNRASECNCLFSHKTHPSIPNRHDPHPVFLLAPSSACVLPVKQVLICRACKIKKLEFIEDELSSLLPLPLQRSLHQIVVSSHLRSILAIMNRVIFLSTTMFTRAKKRGLDMQRLDANIVQLAFFSDSILGFLSRWDIVSSVARALDSLRRIWNRNSKCLLFLFLDWREVFGLIIWE